MKFNIYHLPTIIAILTTLVGMIVLSRLKKIESIILFILWLIVLTDIIAINQSFQNRNTSIYYNLLIPVEISITLYIYYLYIPVIRTKRIILISIFIFIFFSIFNALFLQDIQSKLATYNFFIGGFMVTLFSYFLWKQEIEHGNLSSLNIILWFAAANFFYYGTVVPVLCSNNWLVTYSQKLALPVYTINLVMFGIWAFIIGSGFIWKLKQKD